ncbi:hypothetical protein LUZ60_002803 [Juncus effusus]|nr:hypothetical protein LUZ60_002803 [Juncus effusus]
MDFEVTSDMLYKVGLFVLVQALVYFILTSSSDVFSNEKRSLSFRRVRSVSMRRMEAFLSDMPPGGEPSPKPSTDKLD